MKYDKYIGLPYQENGRTETGTDCWGLARLYYKNELDIELPSYDELYDGSLDASVIDLVQIQAICVYLILLANLDILVFILVKANFYMYAIILIVLWNPLTAINGPKGL